MTPLDSSFSAALLIEDHAVVELARVSWDEEVSCVGKGEVVVCSPEPLAPAELVLKRGALRLRRGPRAVRDIPLWITSAGYATRESDGSVRQELAVADPLWPLTESSKLRRFRDARAEDVAKAVVAPFAIPLAWRVTSELPRRPFVVQHGESDLDFLRRVLATDGLVFWVDETGTLIVTDHTPSAPSAFDAPIAWTASEGMLGGGDGAIIELRRGSRIAPGSVTLRDYDWKKPLSPLVAMRAGARDADLEVYNFPGGFRDQREAENLCQMRLDAHRALATYLEGRGALPELRAGTTFSVSDGAGTPFAGEYFAVRSRLSYERGDGSTGSVPTYQTSFTAIPRSVPYRTHADPKRPASGISSVVARGPRGEDIHTDPWGRFKGEMPWDEEAKGTDEGARWVRLLQPCSSGGLLARTGWEMAVAFLDGDPERPIGVARQMNVQAAPAYEQPANQSAMAIKTRSSPQTGGASELRMEDGGGRQEVALTAQRDLSTRVKNNQSVRIERDDLEVVGGRRLHDVGGDRTVTVAGDRSRAVHGAFSASVAGDYAVEVGGRANVTSKGQWRESISGDASERVGGLRLTVDGGIASPADILKKLIPDPRSTLASVVGAAKGAALAPVTGVVSRSHAPVGAARGIASTARSTVPTDGGLDSLVAAATAASSLRGQLDAARGAVTQALGAPNAARAAVGQIGDALKGGLDAAKSQALASLKGLVPNLSSVASLVPLGSIQRSAATSFHRRIGGAYVGVTLGDISTKTAVASAELTGGVRVVLTPKNIERAIKGSLVSTTAGTAMRTAQGSIVVRSDVSTTKVAGVFTASGGKSLVLRGDRIRIGAGAGIKLASGAASLHLTPGRLALEGTCSTEVPAILFAGATLDMTKA